MADPTGGMVSPLPMSGVATQGIGSLFPNVNAQSNPLYAAATAGMNETTGQAAAGQQLTLQDIINQSQALNLQNQQADQPNIAAQRALTGMNTATDIAQQPQAAAQKAAMIAANVAKFQQSASEDQIKTLHQGAQSIEAAAAVINGKDFDPIRDSDRVNKILDAGHPGSNHTGILTPVDIAKINSQASTASQVRSALEQSMGQGQTMASEQLKARTATTVEDTRAQTQVGVANIAAAAEIQKGLVGMIAAAAGNAAKFQEELIKLPVSQQTQSVALLEQKANGGVISDETYNKLVATTKKDYESNDQLKISIGKEAAAVKQGILAGDLDAAKRKAVSGGYIDQQTADNFKGDKTAFGGVVEKAILDKMVDAKAQKFVDDTFPKHSPKVDAFDITQAANYATRVGTNVFGAMSQATSPVTKPPQIPATAESNQYTVTNENITKAQQAAGVKPGMVRTAKGTYDWPGGKAPAQAVPAAPAPVAAPQGGGQVMFNGQPLNPQAAPPAAPPTPPPGYQPGVVPMAR